MYILTYLYIYILKYYDYIINKSESELTYQWFNICFSDDVILVNLYLLEANKRKYSLQKARLFCDERL